MAKANPVSQLLRSLARAGKAQQRLVTKLVAASAPKAVKRTGSSSRKVPIRSHERKDVHPAPGNWQAGQFAYPLQSRSHLARMNYWLYTPEQIPETVVRHGWPLIVMLHGCHQSATQLAKGTRMNHLAEGKGYAVLYPQQPLSMQAQRCWRWYSSSVQQGSDEAAALAGLIEKICTQYPINRSRIYACGISAGAGMAAILALNHPELIAAVGLHSSPVFGAASNAVDGLRVMRHGSATPAEGPIERILEHRRRPSLTGVALPMPLMPVLTIQGDDDKVVHPVNQQQLIRQWLRLNGMPHDTGAQRITIKPSLRGGSRNAHEIHDYLLGNKPVVRSVRISGLGHAWSGGDPSERFNAKAGPDAGRLIIDFFGKHRR